jgi:hypothetical protein
VDVRGRYGVEKVSEQEEGLSLLKNGDIGDGQEKPLRLV